MTDFVRQTLSADAVQAIRPFDQTTGKDYKQFMKLPTVSKYFKTPQLLAILKQALGDRILQYFLQENSEATLHVAAHILDDHLRTDDVRPKDLQINLVVNTILSCVRAKNFPKANRYGYGENMVRYCNFDAQFKLGLKIAMFDCKAVDIPWLVIAHHQPDSDKPGIWLLDKK